MTSRVSPFLYPESLSKTDSLAIVHLKRDLQTPTILKDRDDDNEGYSEGKVINTRFGSFPHTTLIGLHWGSQVRASKVDTGSRGREKKRKRDEVTETAGPVEKIAKVEPEQAIEKPVEAKEEVQENGDTPAVKKEATPSTAPTGFIHLLPPTPENWTSSLPHRTQVVYTPDYSYVLHRIKARPGVNIIEAGAGSGSFTHASARAVFSGYPGNASTNKRRKLGKVWSFEFHEQRHEKLVKELQDHGMEGVVQITHRDVCENGFLVNGESPKANSIFLDLPAPWLALPHLARSPPPKTLEDISVEAPNGDVEMEEESAPYISALDPCSPVHICTFSPCIEQVQKTISVMRRLGWIDIEMVEVAHKRFEIRRDRIGIDNGNQHGLLSTPANVDEAVARLVDVEGTFKAFHATGEKPEIKKRDKPNPNNKQKILEGLIERKIYKEGNLVHRVEQELKAHTSYLVFAILPREWSAEDEANAKSKWHVEKKDGEADKAHAIIGMSKRQQRRAEKQAHKEKEAAAAAALKANETTDGNIEGVVPEAEGDKQPGEDMALKSTETNNAVEIEEVKSVAAAE
ncbi:hypothetical protein HYFRA_00006327 [Hymenoscyphus fraxineus]|uniref:tRNA (adenine(58)-N(1))-methyltransferase catalytic subunit TRM61 n=1 Tax=Hymenoscyphus fraxineus TaxID=746836 RepID=A0A9N9L970_9HELO|nr:hypothetical protein HYFRA_00006327 [Hymenoscyphus fraxineus]